MPFFIAIRLVQNFHADVAEPNIVTVILQTNETFVIFATAIIQQFKSTQFGSYAAQLVEVERYGVTVAMVNRRVTENRLADIAGKTRNVPENCELLSVARRMGVCLG